MSCKAKKNGFTLIEVLIALLIIAIALSAIIRSMHQSIRVADKVKTDMIAHWVAMNALSEIQIGMIQAPQQGEPVKGFANMVGNRWDWQATLKNADSLKYASQLHIEVIRNKRHIGSLDGFIQ